MKRKPIRKSLTEMKSGDIFKCSVDGKEIIGVYEGLGIVVKLNGDRITEIKYHPVGSNLCCSFYAFDMPNYVQLVVVGNEADRKKRAVKAALISTATAAIITVLIVAFVLCSVPQMERVEWEEVEHHVQSGQTLWEISKLYCPENIDCREWIEEIKEINGIGSTIYAGDCLTVLIEKTR